MKRWLAEKMRDWADLLDRDTGYCHSQWTFRIVRGQGAVTHRFENGVPTNIRDYGTPLFYRPIDYKGIEDG